MIRQDVGASPEGDRATHERSQSSLSSPTVGIPSAVALFGYFTDAAQPEPAYDPGLEVPCPVCCKPLSLAPVRTYSVMLDAGTRSYFFRTHQACDNEHPEAREAWEGAAVDELAVWERSRD
jgi:hypothetical protein